MNEDLPKLIMLAKAAIYDHERAKTFIKMIETRTGAINAVGSVIAALEQKIKIDPAVMPNLAINIYLLMVDVAMNVTGQKPDKAIMRKTIDELMSHVGAGNKPAGPQAAGLLGSA